MKRTYMDSVYANPNLPPLSAYSNAVRDGGNAAKSRKTTHTVPSDPTPAYQPWKIARNAARSDKVFSQGEYIILKDKLPPITSTNRFEQLDDDVDLSDLPGDIRSPPFRIGEAPPAYQPATHVATRPLPAPPTPPITPAPAELIPRPSIVQQIANYQHNRDQHDKPAEALESGGNGSGGGSGGGGVAPMDHDGTTQPTEVQNGGGTGKPSTRRRGGRDDDEQDHHASASATTGQQEGPALAVGESFLVPRDPDNAEFVHHADPYGILALAGLDLKEAVAYMDKNDAQFLLVHLDRVKIKPADLAAAREDMRINLARTFQGSNDIFTRATFNAPIDGKSITAFPVHNLLSAELECLEKNIVVVTDLRVSKAGFVVFRSEEVVNGVSLIGSLSHVALNVSKARVFCHAERVISGVDYVRRTVLDGLDEAAVKKFFDDNLVVDRLDIEDRKKAPAPVWNVYLDFTDRNISARMQRDIRLAIIAADWNCDAAIGLGLTLEIKWMCTRCTGRDHPAGMCPFMKMKGWPGALQLEEMQKAQKVAASRARGTATIADTFIRPARVGSQRSEKAKGKRPVSKKA